MAKYKVGLVGLHQARQFADIFNAYPEFEVTALCDTNKTLLNEVGDELGIAERFTDYHRFVETDLDVIEMSTTGRTPYSLVQGQGIIDKIFWLYERTPSWVSWLIAAGLALFAIVMFFFIGGLPAVAASGLKYGLRLLGFGLAKDTPRPDGAEPQQHATSPGAIEQDADQTGPRARVWS